MKDGAPEKKIYAICVLIFFLLGCGTVSSRSPGVRNPVNPVTGQTETPQDVEKALTAVTGSLSGKEINSKDLEVLSRQVQKDEEAKSAVEAVSGAIRGDSIAVKYCPVDGEHYSSNVEICPEHNVKLKSLEE